MQVILIQDVQHLGSLGDQVQVKDGFARNYLLPRGMAIVATSKRTGQIEHQRKRLEQLRQGAIAKAQAETEKVAALELRVLAKAGVNGKLFGSVTNRDIQAALAEQGYELDRRAIQLHTLIKSVGNFTATVKLHTDVKVDVGIKVEALGDPEAGAGKEGEEGDAAAEGAAMEAAAVDEASPDETQAVASGAGAGDAPAADQSAAAAPTASGDAPDGTPDNDHPETHSDGGDADDTSGGQN